MPFEDLPIHPSTGLTALGLLSDGRPIWPVLGGAPEEEEQDDDKGEQDDEEDDKSSDDGQADDKDEDEEDDKPLGPAGEKALAAEKAKRRKEADRRRAAEAELAKLRGGDDDAVSQARREEQAKANVRIVKSTIRAVAAGKLADPADAVLYLSPDQFEVGEDGEVDEAEIAEAITDLIKKKPHLAAQGGKRFQGTGDNGARPKPKKPSRPTSLGEAVTRKYAK